MERKVVLITGATSGIGKETAISLARRGYEVIITGRRLNKGAVAVEDIRYRCGHKAVHFNICDHSSMEQIGELADFINDEVGKLDVLINNAGGWFPDKKITDEGFEMTHALNHLGHFLLTHRLFKLLDERNGRIINVNSGAHLMGELQLDDLEYMERDYYGFPAYCDAKLLNMTAMLHAAHPYHNEGIAIHFTNPGLTDTDLISNASSKLVPPAWRIGMPFFKLFAQPHAIHKGARPSIYFADGKLVDDSKPLYLNYNLKEDRQHSVALDPEHQKEAYNKSKKLLESYLH